MLYIVTTPYQGKLAISLDNWLYDSNIFVVSFPDHILSFL